MKELFPERRMSSCPRLLPVKDTEGPLLQVNFEGCKVRIAGNFCTSDVLETVCKREELRLVDRGIPETRIIKKCLYTGSAKGVDISAKEDLLI